MPRKKKEDMSEKERQAKLDPDKLNGHSYALWAVGLIFQKQGQPIELLDCDNQGFTLKLRINLQSIQAQRLLLKPINETVAGYTAEGDFQKKELRIQRVIPRRKSQPAADSGKAAA